MKALAAELKCSQLDDRDREGSEQQLRDSCAELRQELLKLKKENQRLRERLGDGQQQHDDRLQLCPLVGQLTNVSGYKTLGSGYRIPTTSLSDIS